jgi:hypothetical protein
MDAPAAAATWEARPARGAPELPGAVRWGVVRLPSGRRVARERREAAGARGCAHRGARFVATRTDQVTCSPACRQRAYRQRRRGRGRRGAGPADDGQEDRR